MKLLYLIPFLLLVSCSKESCKCKTEIIETNGELIDYYLFSQSSDTLIQPGFVDQNSPTSLLNELEKFANSDSLLTHFTIVHYNWGKANYYQNKNLTLSIDSDQQKVIFEISNFKKCNYYNNGVPSTCQSAKIYTGIFLIIPKLPVNYQLVVNQQDS